MLRVPRSTHGQHNLTQRAIYNTITVFESHHSLLALSEANIAAVAESVHEERGKSNKRCSQYHSRTDIWSELAYFTRRF